MSYTRSREERRLMAGEDLKRGMRKIDVVRNYGVSYEAVRKWAAALKRGETLHAKPRNGRRGNGIRASREVPAEEQTK